MRIHNQDMFPNDTTRARFDRIAPLLDNPLFDAAFIKHDKLALRAKKIYHRVGRFAIFLIAISAIYTIADALILKASDWTQMATLSAAVLAIIGIVLQTFIFVTRQKQTWLLNRFACERIRSLKFQSFHLGDNVACEATLKDAVEEFSARELSRLENDLNSGVAALESFNPESALETPPHLHLAKADPAMAEQSNIAYAELRIRYQSNFAAAEVSNLSGRMRAINSLKDILYFAAAGIALLSLAFKIFDTERDIPTDAIDFMAVSLFIAGATKAIMDNALLQEQSQGRYETYHRKLERSAVMIINQKLSLDATVDAIEEICLNELYLFCQDALRVSYRF